MLKMQSSLLAKLKNKMSILNIYPNATAIIIQKTNNMEHPLFFSGKYLSYMSKEKECWSIF